MKHLLHKLTAACGLLVVLNACVKPDVVERNDAAEVANIWTEIPGLKERFTAAMSANKDTAYIDMSYFYPAESDNEVDLTNLILRTSIPVDAKIDPAMGTPMDLSKPVTLTVTSGTGTTKQMVVVVRKVGDLSVKNASVTFTDGGASQTVSAVPNGNDLLFFILPGINLSAVKLNIEVSRHSRTSIANGATINLTNPVPVTVTGVDGRTQTYTLKAVEPKKLDYGVGISRLLWKKSAAQLPGFALSDFARAMAVSGDYIVVSMSTTPSTYKIYNRFTGEYVQDMVPPPGGFRSFAVANDSLGHILVTSFAAANSKVFIYRYQDPFDAAPVKLVEWTSPASGGLGRRVNVYGNVNGNAVITATGGQSSTFYRWTVVNGAVPAVNTAPEAVVYQSMTGPTPYPFYWEVQPTSVAAGGDYFVNYPAEIALVNGTSNQRQVAFANDAAAVGTSHMAMDYFVFNRARYLASAPFLGGVLTKMGMSLFDVTDASRLSLQPGSPEFAKFRVFNSADVLDAASNGNGAGDICAVLSPDKEKVYVYTLLTNGGIMAHEFTKYAP